MITKQENITAAKGPFKHLRQISIKDLLKTFPEDLQKQEPVKAKPEIQIEEEKPTPPEKVYGLLVVVDGKEEPILHDAFINLICFCCYSTREKAQKALTATIVDQNFVDGNDCTLSTFNMEFVIKEMTFEEAVKLAKTKRDASNIAIDLNFGNEEFYKLEDY